MTERKKLKKELGKLRSFRKSLPNLIDCSEVYGDNSFNDGDYEKIDKQIADIENKIADIYAQAQLTIN